MKKEIITTGKTVEEAVAAAVAELGAGSADDIKYEVLEEPKKGLFGIGSTPAKISATYTPSGVAVAYDMLKTLMKDMGIEGNIVMRNGDNDDTVLSVEGDGTGILIGHHGETLDSLQYLANLAANRKVDGEKREYVKITLDAEGYRAKREEALRLLARRMAEKVLKYKKSVMLEPMNPYERRIIHSEVQNIEGVSTNSIGSENNRKVVMYLDDKGMQAGKKSSGKKNSGNANVEPAGLPSADELY